MNRALPPADLEHVLHHTRNAWEGARGARLFITGGTGFFGAWLLESFIHANRVLGLNASAVVLSRDPAAFALSTPHLANDAAVSFVEGDVRHFTFPAGPFTHIVHAATEASPGVAIATPYAMFEGIVAGTQHVLDFAAHVGARRFLLTSSGAVYGAQPPELTRLSEAYSGGPDPMSTTATYGEAKRVAEHLCVLAGGRCNLEVVVARCFAFVGPRLPLDQHFAIGNFIRDAIAGGPVRVSGDGTPYRSYMYAADLAVWLWTLLFSGAAGRAYNVGSGHAISIRNLAGLVANLSGTEAVVHVAHGAAADAPPARYVPDVTRAERELGLSPRIELAQAIVRTMDWTRGR